ncbi:MFS transporter [Streptomyces sp. CWNU-52B]|uniref:MFS transporter n=1 Tax=unclassified Streptomyces TaxID=2593676 RepID=UPI0039C0D8E5
MSDATRATGARTTDHSKGLLLSFVCFGVFMVYLDATIVNVALPDIQRDLDADLTGLQWVVDAYALAFACLLLTSGTVGDILGRKRLFLGGLVGFTLSSVLCALAGSTGVLLAGRALQGVCGSVMIPVSLALVSATYTEPAARAKAIGVWAGIGGLALSAGPLVGGLLVDGVGWQSIFWVNVPIGVLAAAVLARLLTENRGPRARRLDIVGQLLFVVAIASLAYALIEGNTEGWASALIVGAFAASGAALVAFVVWELRQPAPMLPLKLFREPVVAVAGAVNFLSLFGLFAAIFLLTLQLQSVQGLSSVETGVRFLALTVPIMVASFAASVVAARTGPRAPIVAGSLLSAGGLYGLTALDAGSGFAGYWWALTLLGAGVSFVGAPATVALLGAVPPEQAGTASGISNTFRQVGAVFGVALAGALLLRHLRDALPGALARAPLPQDARDSAYTLLSDGDLSRIDSLPPGLRRPVLDAVGPVFVDGVHLVMQLAAACTLVGGLCALVLLGRGAGRTAVGAPAASESDESDESAGTTAGSTR